MRKRRKRPSSTPVQTNPAHLSIGDFLFLEEWLNQKAGESGFIKRKSRKIHPRNLLASLVEESLRGSPPCSTASPTRWRHKGCKCSTPHMKMAASVPGSPPVKIGSSPLSASTTPVWSRPPARRWTKQSTPFFPTLRPDPMAVSGASRRKRTSSSQMNHRGPVVSPLL